MTCSTLWGLRPLLLGMALLVVAAPHASAQDIDELPAVTDTYALENARVVQSPGQVLESATVVVEDGLIDAVGEDVEIPYDARRIKADSLVVYAGFIDGFSHAGIEMPEPSENGESNGEEVDPGDPPPDASGIQPDRSVRPFLTPDGSDLKSLRKIGFTTGHVAPEGEMLPGSSALVFYGGDSASDMVLTESSSLFAQIASAPGYIYPATDMAVIAKLRELYREAERRQQLEAEYRENPRGMRRPPQDPVHSALFPVLDGDTPFTFYADEALSLHRILDLKQELGFPLMLAGLQESHEMVDAISEVDAHLFLTLALPEKPKRSAKKDTLVADTTDRPAKYYDPDLRTPSYEEVPDEEGNLELRHAIERQTYLETAATLHEEGLQFGFSTREAKPGDVRKNLRTMIDEGLPEDAALAALTTRPAGLLGVRDRLGTVEEGKIANLVVTDGDYFADDTKVKHVFVDGQLYDYSTEEEEGEISGDVSKVIGTWSYTIETPRGDRSGTLTIEGDQSGLEGTLVNSRSDEQEISAVSFDGTTLSFTIQPSQGPTLSISVTVEGDTFEGTVSTPGPSVPITGERTSTPSETRK